MLPVGGGSEAMGGISFGNGEPGGVPLNWDGVGAAMLASATISKTSFAFPFLDPLVSLTTPAMLKLRA